MNFYLRAANQNWAISSRKKKKISIQNATIVITPKKKPELLYYRKQTRHTFVVFHPNKGKRSRKYSALYPLWGDLSNTPPEKYK